MFGMGTGGSPLLSSPDFLRVFIIPSKLNNITQTFLSNFLRPLNLRMRSVHTSCLLRFSLGVPHFPVPLGYRQVHPTLRFANPCFASGRFSAPCVRRCLLRKHLGQVLGLLVPVSYIHYCTSTSGLSTM